MMNTPADCKYTKSHEWVRFTGENLARVGLSGFAQSSLGDIVFVNLPQPGDEVHAGQSLGDVESVKAVSEILSPVSGTVSAVNEELLDAPEQINSDPYGSWLVEISGIGEMEELLDAEAYEEFCKEEE